MDPRTSPGDSCEPSHKGQINGTTILQMENQENEISYDGPCHCQLLVEGPNQEGRDDHQDSCQISASSIFDIRSFQYLKRNEVCDNYQNDANHTERLEFDPFTRKLDLEEYYNAMSILVNNSNLSPEEKDRILVYLARMETCTFTEASWTESTCSHSSTCSNVDSTNSLAEDDLECQPFSERNDGHESIENEQPDVEEMAVDEDPDLENPTEGRKPTTLSKKPLLEWKMSPRIQPGLGLEPVHIPGSANEQLKSVAVFRPTDYEDPTLMCNRFNPNQ